ncbi:hypothetical protein DY000_02006765 [Brassica cretica]|uniref:Uncharacterized protein n=1 Tax=Brassica cretica TaxID=69181 RepID=A0ABQ7C557_BRACR|nr:hypothetical protein DY000_02006765 [Brassica cretica]
MLPREHGALVGTWPNGHVALGARGGTWPEQMVYLSICCSEHDVSRCFSEHGGTLLMSWRSWSEPVRNLALATVKLVSSGYGRLGPPSLGMINHSAWKPDAGIRIRTQGQGPRPWGRNPEPGGRTWKPEAGVGNNMVFFIGLRELHRSIKFLVEFGVGRRLVAWDERFPPWWGLVGVGRKLDGESGNVCIKGDASTHTPDACAAPVALLGLSSSRTSVCIS